MNRMFARLTPSNNTNFLLCLIQTQQCEANIISPPSKGRIIFGKLITTASLILMAIVFITNTGYSQCVQYHWMLEDGNIGDCTFKKEVEIGIDISIPNEKIIDKIKVLVNVNLYFDNMIDVAATEASLNPFFSTGNGWTPIFTFPTKKDRYVSFTANHSTGMGIPADMVAFTIHYTSIPSVAQIFSFLNPATYLHVKGMALARIP